MKKFGAGLEGKNKKKTEMRGVERGRNFSAPALPPFVAVTMATHFYFIFYHYRNQFFLCCAGVFP